MLDECEVMSIIWFYPTHAEQAVQFAESRRKHARRLRSDAATLRSEAEYLSSKADLYVAKAEECDEYVEKLRSTNENYSS